ncbi:hypothetical protein BS50DRAFT_660254 [Corynespora cassiicola Philippines]|uniref:Uncharacterized protein n=1 Tax=Corynespora cassiicola Philippines TaxID=1448308 RepID=A0A2T2P0L3_CORCC|nr:hypothetical protein BS50DRAFT_660254 [Corynespora cassiicola Philippines]
MVLYVTYAAAEPTNPTILNMPLEENRLEIAFNSAWRTLSHSAHQDVKSHGETWIKEDELDSNGLIPRDRLPDLYDAVLSIITSLGTESQYLAWSWIPSPTHPSGHQPLFTYPKNRKIWREETPNERLDRQILEQGARQARELELRCREEKHRLFDLAVGHQKLRDANFAAERRERSASGSRMTKFPPL